MKMKVYLLAVVLTVLSFGTAAAQDTEAKPTIELTPEGDSKIILHETEYNFGEIIQGESVTHVFTFVNEGSGPLVIKNITTPCGCTAPSWSKEPIPPGGTGEIHVKFNSTGKRGSQIKTLSVIYNGEASPEFITIKGNVKPKTTN